MLRKKENFKYLGILEVGTIKQGEAMEKIRKELLLKNEKASRNQAQQPNSHQRDKHLDSLPCKILSTILKMDNGATKTNGPKDKKIDEYVQGFISKRWHRLYVSRKEGRAVFASIEDCVDSSKNCIKKTKKY